MNSLLKIQDPKLLLFSWLEITFEVITSLFSKACEPCGRDHVTDADKFQAQISPSQHSESFKTYHSSPDGVHRTL